MGSWCDKKRQVCELGRHVKISKIIIFQDQLSIFPFVAGYIFKIPCERPKLETM